MSKINLEEQGHTFCNVER